MESLTILSKKEGTKIEYHFVRNAKKYTVREPAHQIPWYLNKMVTEHVAQTI